MTAKRILFRADASERIGSGHVMRCLTLANALRAQSAQCVFAAAAMPESLTGRIRAEGHEVVLLPHVAPVAGLAVEDVWSEAEQALDKTGCLKAIEGRAFDWVIVDHYGLDEMWETAMRAAVSNIMVIDDLANRVHDSDLLLDQNLGRNPTDYDDLVAPSTRVLAGPRYALLRPEFAAARPAALKRREDARLSRLLISLGGSDPQNVTGRVMRTLNGMALPDNLRITTVLGSLAGSLDEVLAFATTMRYPTEVLVDVRDMATLMSECDLAIGAAGATAWERCCLGLPSIVLVLAENQRPGAEALAATGAAATVSAEELASLDLEAFFAPTHGSSPAYLMSTIAAGLCDGRGVELVSGVFNA